MSQRSSTNRHRSPDGGTRKSWIDGWPALALVVGVGLAVRLLHCIDSSRLPLFGRPTVDAALYVELAKQIARSWVFEEPFYKPPVYPYLLAGMWRLVGESWLLLRLPGIVFGAATCGVAWWLGGRVFGPRVGLLAGLLYAVHRIAVYFEGELLEIGIVTLLHAAALALVLWADVPAGAQLRNRGRLRAVIAGAALGIGTLARPTLLLFDAVAIAWLGRRRALPALAALALTLLPVTLHNALRGGGFVLVSSNLGVNFYLGNNPQANGRIAAAPEFPASPAAAARTARVLAEEAAGRPLRAADVSGFWLRRGLAYDVEHPSRALSLVVRKLFFAWNAAEISDNEDLAGLARHLRVFRVLPVGSWLLAPLGLVGLVFAPRRRDTLLLRGFLVAQILALLPFFVVSRFRLPWTPALAVLAAWCALEFLARVRGRRAGRAALAAAIAVVGLACGLPAFGVRAPVEFDFEYKLGYAYLEEGRVDEALAAFREAVRRNPRNALAQNALGVLLGERGEDLDVAVQAIEAALALDPSRTPQYAESLAGVHLRCGDATAALEACARGLASGPDPRERAALLLRVAQAHRSLGDSAQEARALRGALAAGLDGPRAAEAGRRLGVIEPPVTPPAP